MTAGLTNTQDRRIPYGLRNMSRCDIGEQHNSKGICTSREHGIPEGLVCPRLLQNRRSGLSFTPSYIGTTEGVRLHFCPCGGQAKIAVATRICTDRSNMPPAYCDFDLRVPASRCKRKRRGEFFIHSVLYWYAGRDSNPQPSEPESDALSIEPPAHNF